MINIRRTVDSQKLHSEAAYRFSRGVHPALAPRGVQRGLELMRRWAGGAVAQGLVDNYPLPAERSDRGRSPPAMCAAGWASSCSRHEIADLLVRLEFDVQIDGETDPRQSTPTTAWISARA